MNIKKRLSTLSSEFVDADIQSELSGIDIQIEDEGIAKDEVSTTQKFSENDREVGVNYGLGYDLSVGYKMTDQEFQQHAEKIRKNIIGHPFSIGDERLLKNAFDFIASTKRGRRIIEEVSADTKINSIDIPKERQAAGFYTPGDDKIAIERKYIKEHQNEGDEKKMTLFGQEMRIHGSEARVLDIIMDSPLNFETAKKAMNEMKNAKQVDFKAVEIIWHELRHAMQDQKGLMLNNENVNVDQKLTAEKLIEAETRAWDIVNNITYEFIDMWHLIPDTGPQVNKDLEVHTNGTSYSIEGSTLKERLELFKNYDGFKAAQRSVTKTTDDGISFVVESEGNGVDRVFKYGTMLQDNLRKYGDLDLAQRATVGEIIADYMKPKESHQDSYWLNAYNKQAINRTHFEVGNLSSKGNEALFNKVLEYYEQEYGVAKDKIQHHNIDDSYQEKINILKDLVNIHEDIVKLRAKRSDNQQTSQRAPASSKHTATQEKPCRPNDKLEAIKAVRNGQTTKRQPVSESGQKTGDLSNLEKGMEVVSR